VASSSNTPRVLLVEDEPYWQGVLKPTLSTQRWQTEVASTVEEARCLLSEQHFDAFVVDVRLAEYDEENMDGLEFVQDIQNRPARLARTFPILILSVWEPALDAARKRFGTLANVRIVDKMDRVRLQDTLDNIADNIAQQLAAPRQVAPPPPQGF
jgi:CheY-like chemotaxis protein